MKKRLSTLLGLLLALSVLTLAACGNSSASGDGSQSKAEEEVVVDPAEKFVGTWELAAIEQQGVVILGDFSAMLDDGETMSLTINENKTGSVAYGEDAADITWELKDDDTMILSPVEDATEGEQEDEAEAEDEAEDEGTDTSDATTLEVVFDADTNSLVMAMDDGETNGSAIFTADGTYEGYEVLDIDAAQAITSQDDLVGEWGLTGMMFLGMTMYGDAESLAAATGGETDTTATFDEDGSAKLMGSDVSWAVDESGATVDLGSGITIPLQTIDGKLVINMGNIMGIDMVMVFSK